MTPEPKNTATEREDIVEVKYIIKNEGTASANAGVRIMMDTQLGENDAAPFRVPGVGSVTFEREYTGSSIPPYWQAFDSLTSPQVISQGTLLRSSLNKPDKVQFTNWRRVYDNAWDYTANPSYSIGDSAVSVLWEPKAIAAGQELIFTTYYGISELVQDLRPPLAVSLYGDASVRATENGYEPNPFVVTAYIENTMNFAEIGVMAKINLPSGLKLVSTETFTKSLGTISGSQEKQVSWSVEIDRNINNETLEYSVDVWSASGPNMKTVKKSIYIPELSTSGPPIIIIPGIMGSRLFEDAARSKIAWTPVPFSGSLVSLDENMNMSNLLFVRNPENQNAQDVIREYGAINDYVSLINRLCSDFPNREIYFFSYDWRQSNQVSADKLMKYIDETLKADKVDLVCHSMGGIVASIYATNEANFNKINKIITLGTPYEGAPMIYEVMLTKRLLNDRNDNKDFWERLSNFFSNTAMFIVGGLHKDVKTTFNGAVELVPSKEYRSENNFLYMGENINQYLFEALHDEMFPSFTKINSVQELIKSGKDKLRNSDKSYYGIGVDGTKRTISVASFDRRWLGGELKIIEDDLRFSNTGDGTVPYLSAIQMEKLYDLPLGRVRAFPFDHGGLHKNSDSQNWVVNILNGVNDLSYTNQPPKGNPYIVVNVECPVDATITLGDKKLSSAPGDQVIVSEFGELYLLGENFEIKTFALDDNKEYDIELVGTDLGTMDYSIEYYDEDNNKVDERVFKGVPITNRTVIKTGSDNSGEMRLHIDTNGDGVDDGLWVSDGSNLEGKEVDITPPEIVCSIVNDYEALPIGTIVEFNGSDPNNDVPVTIKAMLTTANGDTEVESGFKPAVGVYQLKITATDDSGNLTEKVVHFVIYDPEGQFVTGGGWINSPSGAYTINPEMSGVATFGFVSKYKKGATAPTGETEFKFEAANMEFYASNYQWLVVAGSKVQFKGTGTINGSGNYGFMVTATDGQQTKKDDRFRIKIWDIETDETVYDNQIGTDVSAEPGQSTVLGGGSISIHK